MPASKKTTDTDRKIGALIRKHRLAIAPEWQLLPPSWRGLTARTQNRGGTGAMSPSGTKRISYREYHASESRYTRRLLS